MSNTIIFLIGLVASNLCLAFAVATFVGLKQAAGDYEGDAREGRGNVKSPPRSEQPATHNEHHEVRS